MKNNGHNKPEEKLDLDNLLDKYSVMEIDKYHVEVNKDLSNKELSGLIGWFGVCNDEGVCAYFGEEKDALAFRLMKINMELNG